MGNPGAEADLQAVIHTYAEEIRRCRYGTFRGVIRDGRIVIFAIEHEWRPRLEKHAQRTHREEEAS